MSSVKKTRGAYGVASALAASASAVSSVRRARGTKDKLLLANAAASIAVAITGGLIAARAMRKGREDS